MNRLICYLTFPSSFNFYPQNFFLFHFELNSMDFDEFQINDLRLVFQQSDIDQNGLLNEEELRIMLSDFDIDESFAPAMFRIFAGSNTDEDSPTTSTHEKGVGFDDILKFFRVLMSGDIKNFFRLLFNAIDTDKNGALSAAELIDFSRLVGDPLSCAQAKMIIDQCDQTSSDGSIGFEKFWVLYSSEQVGNTSGYSNYDVNYSIDDNQDYYYDAEIFINEDACSTPLATF
ncbi:calmodulin [Tritrichomonas foetus]|uniref:Calmodulin n=1 Tax=Tritrichomonas foetus TaxID=1144522 RepID=A0A1J4KHC1_9EUKA|nr:calmodulin [Tritrichomonas foetus]|eukprot:OHT10807.1 calmodulin [Tritrichomonas foetus]